MDLFVDFAYFNLHLNLLVLFVFLKFYLKSVCSFVNICDVLSSWWEVLSLKNWGYSTFIQNLPVLPWFLPVLKKLFSLFSPFSFQEVDRSVIIPEPFKQKNLRLSSDFFTKNCITNESNLLAYLENGTEIADIEPYFLQYLIYFTVNVLAVQVDVVQAYNYQIKPVNKDKQL